MAIRYAILGLLSFQPLAGYDLKKIFADSPALHWSGNNNQIYRTLADLLREDLVTKDVQTQEKLPAKGVYSITPKGQAELDQWIRSVPELPEFRSTFQVQLMWAAHLDQAELDSLLERYAQDLQMHVLMQREKVRRAQGLLPRNDRESRLWSMITEHAIGHYERELDWVTRLRAELTGDNPPAVQPGSTSERK